MNYNTHITETDYNDTSKAMSFVEQFKGYTVSTEEGY